MAIWYNESVSDMDQKKTVKVFISYANADKIFFELLKEGIEKHSRDEENGTGEKNLTWKKQFYPCTL